MPVRKSTCDVYEVRKDGEYATMALRQWDDRETAGDTGRIRFGGEVLINSSFGSFCETWSYTSVSFKEFLTGVSYSSFMTKCLGLSARVYCPEKTVQLFTDMVNTILAQEDLTPAQAVKVLEVFNEELAVVDQADTPTGFVAAIDAAAESDEFEGILTKAQLEMVFGEARMLKGMKPNPQAVGFWEQLWPELVAQLKLEVAQEKEAAHAA